MKRAHDQVPLDDKEEDALFLATCQGEEEVIKEAMNKYGIEIITSLCSRNDITLLHVAAMRGCLEIVRLLLQNGADADKLDDEGVTPLHHACWIGHLTMAHLLIENGSDVNRDLSGNNYTPLRLACAERNLDLAHLLITNGANINKADDDGITPLHEACRSNNLDLAQLLIQHGADVDKAGYQLQLACKSGNLNLAQLLIKHGADINKGDNDGNTSLHHVSWLGYADVVQFLVTHGANGHKANNTGITLLCIACDQSNSEPQSTYVDIVEELVRYISQPANADCLCAHSRLQCSSLPIYGKICPVRCCGQ